MGKARELALFLAFPLTGWAACFAIIGIGMSVAPQEIALRVHAVAAPLVFALLTLVYIRRVNITSPIVTALGFTGFVIGMDFFVSAILILRSLAMFSSPLGTWIPFSLIFISTLLTSAHGSPPVAPTDVESSGKEQPTESGPVWKRPWMNVAGTSPRNFGFYSIACAVLAIAVLPIPLMALGVALAGIAIARGCHGVGTLGLILSVLLGAAGLFL